MNGVAKPIIISWFVLCTLVVFFLCSFEQFPDYYSYLNWYELSVSATLNNNWVFFKDPGFYLLSVISNNFDFGIIGAIFFLFIISLSCKIFFCIKLLDWEVLFWVLLLYLSRLFIIHDLVQYRAGASIGLSALFVYFYLEKKRIKSFFFLSLALSIHLSSLLMVSVIPIAWFLNRNVGGNIIRQIAILLLILSLSLFFDPYVNLLRLVSQFPLMHERIAPYLDGSYLVSNTSMFNSFVIIKIISYVIFFVWICKNKNVGLTNENYLIYLCFFISIVGLFLFWCFRSNDSLSIRFSDFFALYDIVFFALLLNVFDVFGKFIYRYCLLVVVIVFFISSMKLIN
uniref:Wzy n=1 Tax=Escherichia coli TaxID=562 RepID=D6BV49_ECOLX|nr:Wzy [Escherichia coli]